MRASRRKYHIIYKTTCKVTNRYYIGLHSTDDLTDKYLGSGIRLGRSVKKYGGAQHTREILEIYETRQEAIQREIEIITPELRADPLCMNSGPGGMGTADREYGFTEESRKKISDGVKAAHARGDYPTLNEASRTEEAKAKRAAAHRGQKRSAEQLANLSAGQRRYYDNVDKEVLLERGRKAAQSRAKDWEVTRPDGSTFITTDLQALANELGVSRSSIYHACNRGTEVKEHRITRK